MEAWSQAEIAAVEGRDKQRVWLFEVQLIDGVYRAAQTTRDVTDEAGRTWLAVGAAGEVQGAGVSLGRRPRELVVTLHGLTKGQSLYARLRRAVVAGAPARLYLAWVNSAERLIVQPKLRFAGVAAAAPTVALADVDRATLTVVSGSARAGRLSPPWDASPASHRALTRTNDPIYDRVSEQTQAPQPI
jgi:hypothetical protein